MLKKIFTGITKKRFSIYRKSTLADVDGKTLESVFKDTTTLKEIENDYDKENNCDRCGFRLVVVNPHLWMEGMILCECENCKERFYRKP